jgi:hypothetical protein
MKFHKHNNISVYILKVYASAYTSQLFRKHSHILVPFETDP